MKKALIHDWYYVNGGAEKVVHSLNNIWNDFEHFALVDFLNDADRNFILKGKKAKTTFVQKLPTAKSNHRKFLQLFPLAIEQLDLREFDLILSSSASIGKGVLVNQNQLHICYCHSPMRYAWDLYHQYLEDSKLNKGLKGLYAKWVLNKIRSWDFINSQRVDHFIANSNYIAERIKKTYNRDSTVIYPPVNIEEFELQKEKKKFYFTASRMVPYKKMEVIVKAFNEMEHKKLIVAGDGPELKRLKKIAKDNIEFVGFIESFQLKKYMQNAKAFVFAAEEDFGIIPVEAQACGTPVIGYGKGGLTETVIHDETGVFFYHQTSESIVDAVKYFETLTFTPEKIRKNAERFSKERFEREMYNFVNNKINDFFSIKKDK